MSDEIIAAVKTVGVKVDTLSSEITVVREILTGNGDTSKGVVARQIVVERTLIQFETAMADMAKAFALCQQSRDSRIAEQREEAKQRKREAESRRKEYIATRRWWYGAVIIGIGILCTIAGLWWTVHSAGRAG